MDYRRSYMLYELADKLGVTPQDMRIILRENVLDYRWNVDRYGNVIYKVRDSEIERFMSNYSGSYRRVEPYQRKKIVTVTTILEVPDEWYDEGYQREYNRARNLYERQRIDDLY